ncbi:reverse transcriptase [Plakobranchus ocellatus]|uniref:Reverse transcriptase n=1 Tax=Plakobranchus ocellatus TaxID=259542 RepID=A0AAV4CWZ5_9GAST|nr:reverse transcriptase [Plakobranchus ocellatus]
MYLIPEDIQVMLEDVFNGFKMRFSTERYTTDWINLDFGIAIGCSMCPILFVSAEGGENPANLSGGCYISPLKDFMVDTTILCSKENEICRMLVWLDAQMNWSRMSVKAS